MRTPYTQIGIRSSLHDTRRNTLDSSYENCKLCNIGAYAEGQITRANIIFLDLPRIKTPLEMMIVAPMHIVPHLAFPLSRRV